MFRVANRRRRDDGSPGRAGEEGKGRRPPYRRPRRDAGLEVGLDVVVGGDHPGLQQRHRRVLVDADEPTGTVADPGGDRARTRDQRLLGYADEVAASLLDVGTGLANFLPGRLEKRAPVLRLNRCALPSF